MQKKQVRREEALEYHSKGKPGKIEVVPTKEAKTQRDLSLAYSPGVAEPCKEIALNKEEVYKYTAKGKPGCCDHQRHSRSGTRQYRTRSIQTRNGRQGCFVQDICGH